MNKTYEFYNMSRNSWDVKQVLHEGIFNFITMYKNVCCNRISRNSKVQQRICSRQTLLKESKQF